MTFKREYSIGYLTDRLSRILTKRLFQKTSLLGLAPAQFSVLMELVRTQEATQRDLVERLDVEQGTMTKTLARMQRDGLIQRNPHPGDGRAQLVTPTDEALKILPQAIMAAKEVNDTILLPLTAGERETLLNLLHKLVVAHDDGKAEQDQ